MRVTVRRLQNPRLSRTVTVRRRELRDCASQVGFIRYAQTRGGLPLLESAAMESNTLAGRPGKVMTVVGIVMVALAVLVAIGNAIVK